MKPHAHVNDLSDKARKAFSDWEKDSINFSRSFLRQVQDVLGWPDGEFQRLNYEEIPENARLGPGGFTSARGYHFAVTITIAATRSTLHVPFVARKLPEGAFEIETAGIQHKVSLAQPESMEAMIRHIAEALEEHALLGQFAQVTGFKR